MDYEKLAKISVAYIKDLEDGVISLETSKKIRQRHDEIIKNGEEIYLPSLEWIENLER